MTDIEKKALALVNEVMAELGMSSHTVFHRNVNWANMALCRAIEQHEAFRQDVSDAVEDYCGYVPPDSPCHPITRFIIAKPDHIRGAALDIGVSWGPNDSDSFRAALAARGLEIREKQ